MSATKSNIEWTDTTWNPTTGCTKVSPGCAHCYAETLTARYAGRPGWPAEFKPWVPGNDTVVLHPDRLEEPFKWRTPRRVFVNSMSDLFHEEIPDEFIDKVFAVMALTPQHTYQVLTKRPERMRAYLRSHDVGLRWANAADPRANGIGPGTAVEWTRNGLPAVWLGVTVENQRWADERIPILLDTPAAVRFVSAEPLLGPVDLAAAQNRYGSHELVHRHAGHPDSAPGYLDVHWHANAEVHGGHQPPASGPLRKRAFKGNPWEAHHHHDTTCESLLDWVIVGGESGPGHRSFDPAWARSIVAQCADAGVACFVKQMGGARPGNRLEDLTEDLRVREYPA